jgi:hypothetical protein
MAHAPPPEGTSPTAGSPAFVEALIRRNESAALRSRCDFSKAKPAGCDFSQLATDGSWTKVARAGGKLSTLDLFQCYEWFKLTHRQQALLSVPRSGNAVIVAS